MANRQNDTWQIAGSGLTSIDQRLSFCYGRNALGRQVGGKVLFLIGLLVGTIAGCLICIRYLRREIAADIGPRLRRIQLQLDNLETAVNLGTVTRYADLAAYRPPLPRASEPPFAA
jgi:hypothetical protein